MGMKARPRCKAASFGWRCQRNHNHKGLHRITVANRVFAWPKGIR